MKKFIEAKIAEDKAHALKESLREQVLREFQAAGSGVKFENISWRTQTRNPIDETAFFEWVKASWPDVVDSLRKDEICPLKFAEAQLRRIIDYDMIPPECYSTQTSEIFTVRG
jgi:hypothetical protein